MPLHYSYTMILRICVTYHEVSQATFMATQVIRYGFDRFPSGILATVIVGTTPRSNMEKL